MNNPLRCFVSTILLMVCLLPLTAQVSQMETEYERVSGVFDRREKTAQKQLRTYLEQYPYTTYADEIHFMIAVVQTERGYYKRAIKEFDKSDYKTLTRPHQPVFQFYRGYASLMLSDYKTAAVYFGNLQKHDTEYRQRANYYYAYCQYKMGDYDKALPALLELENVSQYRKTVPYYIAQIYYSRQQYDEVRSRAERLLAELPNNENNGELHRMLGEIYYRENRFGDAVRELQAYDKAFIAAKMEVLRNDLYLMGKSQYRLKQYNEAIATLKRVKHQEDVISEDVNLCLGNAYVQLGDVEQAKLAFLAASHFNLNDKVHYEALYNYALTVYQSSSSIGESETVFTDFIRQYPKSEHVNDIYMLLADAFRRAKNYQAALSALDSITLPNKQLLETKQYLRYQLGSDAFVRGKFDQAIDWFNAVLKDGTPSPIMTDVYYWRAEANYRLKKYDLCQKDLDLFFGRSDATTSPNYMMAYYLRGYVYFQQGEYDNAAEAYKQHVNGSKTTASTYADALNRLGDCLFNARRFEEANEYYDQAVALSAQGSDYALYQYGYSLGLQKKKERKVEVLQQLVNRYPKSDYADDALYEIARANLSLEKEQAAIEAYELLLNRYPRSAYARIASIERAMTYRNLHNYTQAIAAYKYTIEHYPASQEAYAAVEGLESVCIEANKVDEFLTYSKNLSKYNMQVATRDDSLSFVAADLQYRQGHIDEALAQYLPLAERVGSPYAQPACAYAAEIYFDRKEYENAYNYFTKLVTLSSKRKDVTTARLGILRSAQPLNRWEDVIAITTTILDDAPVAHDVREEALFARAQAYRATEQWGLSVVDLNETSKDVRTAVGAESKYLLADSYFQLGAIDNAETEVMAFAQQPTQQQYWLARSLILLSDISVQRGDDFQARQYLLSLKANYTNKDDIAARVADKLAKLDQASSTNQEEEDVL